MLALGSVQAAMLEAGLAPGEVRVQAALRHEVSPLFEL